MQILRPFCPLVSCFPFPNLFSTGKLSRRQKGCCLCFVPGRGGSLWGSGGHIAVRLILVSSGLTIVYFSYLEERASLAVAAAAAAAAASMVRQCNAMLCCAACVLAGGDDGCRTVVRGYRQGAAMLFG